MFLPVAGLVVMGFIPRTEEQLLKVVALLTALAARPSASSLATFDYDKAGTLQFYVNEPWIDAIQSRFIMGCDGEQPAALHPDDGHHAPVHHLQLEPHPRAGQHEGIPHADPAPAGRQGHVRGPGPHPVLRLLRDRPVADVLHDRRLGRRAAAVCASLKFFLFTLFGSAFMLLSFIALFFKSEASSAARRVLHRVPDGQQRQTSPAPLRS